MNNLVITHDQQVVTTSLKVAEVFGKDHKHVIGAIESKMRLAENSANLTQMFVLGEYSDVYGRSQKLYYLNRDGLAFIAFGFTGRQADKFKLEYIREFNRMEDQLENQPSATRLDADQYGALIRYLDKRIDRAVEGKRVKPALPLGLKREQSEYHYDYATPERLAWAKNIRDRMEDLNLTLGDVARPLGIAPNYLCAILQGQRKAKKLLPKIDMVIAL